MHVIKRQTCRVCGSTSLRPAVDLGPQFLQGAFIQKGRPDPPRRRIPTALVRCDPRQDERACGLLQMEHTVPPEILYASYWYVSGTNATMREHLAGIAEQVRMFLGRPPAQVLDIGCNDGTLLRAYGRDVGKHGIDPSDVAARVLEGSDVKLTRALFPSPQFLQLVDEGGPKFDAVTSIAMFYDLEDPVGFARAVKRCLAKGGLWCFEMAYLPATLRAGSYDTIVHEHLEYYSLAVVERILRDAGLRLAWAEENAINGGSFRCYAEHAEAPPRDIGRPGEAVEQIARLRQAEFEMELDTDAPYTLFQQRACVHKKELNDFLSDVRGRGKRVHVYGASTKGNTILQWCGIDRWVVEAAADRNADKVGGRTLGTEIPIVSEEESRRMRPDYYLVLPWHFKKEFLQREEAMIGEGTTFVFPLPHLHFVGKYGAVI